MHGGSRRAAACRQGLELRQPCADFSGSAVSDNGHSPTQVGVEAVERWTIVQPHAFRLEEWGPERQGSAPGGAHQRPHPRSCTSQQEWEIAVIRLSAQLVGACQSRRRRPEVEQESQAPMYSAGRWSFAAVLALMARGSSPGQRKVNRESYLVLVMDDT
jgi:hypothetical protein